MAGLRVAISLIGAAFVAAACGCGAGSSKPTAHLQGTVTIAGKPIPADAEASVTFKPAKSGQARSTSAMIINGTYDAPDVPTGPVNAYVNIQQPTGREITESVSRPYKEYRSLVPSKYGEGIPLEVKGDKADQNFDL